ncbi:S8 family peptidase [Deinococcus deserti]|uniref:Putative peptidase n=1 Tax=Deinococcus deserti (strain DSM 17065 / CIP 109153 / LMG 22923 / VCD115) TaxID=546414 RepID=C1CZE7_DEIDV|nr:S8 family peptidase [Deinococcus deserti]ACO47195.1 putative peptidase, precursor [Deinococcus deserti VCD115]
MNRIPLSGLLTLSVLLAACGQAPNAQAPVQASPVAQAPVPVAAGPEFVEGEVLVQLRSGLSAQAITALSSLGVQSLETVAVTDGAPLLRTRITDAQSVEAKISRLQASGLVRFAEPNWIYQHQATSNDPYYTDGSLWGMYSAETNLSAPANQYGSQANKAWATNTGSSTVYIGVIDEGIDYRHDDLKLNIGVNPGETPGNGIDDDKNGYVDDVYGWDFANGNNTIYDGTRKEGTDKHGTHVAGTIGGVGGNGKGVAGVVWNVKMMSGKFLGSRGGTTANAIKAVDYFTDLKKRHNLNLVATSNSWGGGGFSQSLLDAINRGGDAGILFIAAAGNGGNDGVGDNNDTTANYPSNYECKATDGTLVWDCLIAVAAIDKEGALAKFSNYGMTTVDLGAPGVSVMSTLPNNTYGAYSGTSMATPHVTGGAALYAAAYSSAYGVKATAKQIKDAIMKAANATDTTSLTGKTVTGGRLNVSGFVPELVNP